MSIVCAVDSFVLLDCAKYVNDVYRTCRLKDGDLVELRCPSEVFAIFTPLRMDSERIASDKSPTTKRKRRKRKLANDIFADFNHIRPYVTDCLERLVPLCRKLGFLSSSLTEEEKISNNKEARQACRKWMQIGPTAQASCGEEDSGPLRSYRYEGGAYDWKAATNAIVHYPGNEARIVQIGSENYALPAASAFFNSDIARLRSVRTLGEKFDVIVLDPPWPNKSVKRNKNYRMLSLDSIKDMPIGQLANEDCLVLTWITSNQSHLRYVTDVLYPSWGVTLTATWHWLKITVTGAPVCAVDSPHKRPYEHVLIGIAKGPDGDKPRRPIEDRKVFCSVPSSIHSQKPPLTELLKPYVAADARCLELFARSLLPGWTSWGNHVLQFQNTRCFNISKDGGAVIRSFSDVNKII